MATLFKFFLLQVSPLHSRRRRVFYGAASVAALIGCLFISRLPAHAQEIPTEFTARLELDLCPEYRFGGVVLDVFYRIGNDPTLRAADIVSQTIDAARGKATLDLRFPSTMGTTPFNVVGFCRDAVSFGPASNPLQVSNCDHLALSDLDGDGIPNHLEDTDCSNFFSPGDASNLFNVDTDGDGVRDLVEVVSGTDPTNPGSSPRPYVYSSAPFDSDGDGNANAVVWRSSTGTWFIRDHGTPGNHLAVQFGAAGDVPFTYRPAGSATSSLGVIRSVGRELEWLFFGEGFRRTDGTRTNNVRFGIFGDNLLPGPWEDSAWTNPAVARLFNNRWEFYIFKSDGTISVQFWGGNGDIPKVQDYDGDGRFDIAVFRPAEQKTYIIRSSDGQVEIYTFGTGTADHTVRGDYTGDGVDDISFWEPLTGVFTTMTSTNGFDDDAARAEDPDHYFELQLGLYNIHLPLNWNFQNGRLLYTVVDHATGTRYTRDKNRPNAAPQQLQWGLPGDSQG